MIAAHRRAPAHWIRVGPRWAEPKSCRALTKNHAEAAAAAAAAATHVTTASVRPSLLMFARRAPVSASPSDVIWLLTHCCRDPHVHMQVWCKLAAPVEQEVPGKCLHFTFDMDITNTLTLSQCTVQMLCFGVFSLTVHRRLF